MRTRARRSKRFAGLLTVGLVAGVLPGFYVPARAATTIVVDDDGQGSVADCAAGDPAQTTIGAAVTLALSGDTIKVCPGTYAETVTFPASLSDFTLKGSDPNDRPRITGGIVWGAGMTNVTLQDIEVTDTDGFVINGGSVTDLTMDNVEIDGANVPLQHGVGGGQINGDIDIHDSQFINIPNWVVFDTRSGSGGATSGSSLDVVNFSDNYLSNNGGHVNFRGTIGDETTSVTIDGNIAENYPDAPTNNSASVFKVLYSLETNFTNNSISNIGTLQTSIGGFPYGSGLMPRNAGPLTITGNTFDDLVQGIAFEPRNTTSGGFPDGVVSGGTISNNDFTNNTQGIFVTATNHPNSTLGALNIEFNNFSGNSEAIDNNSATTLDAEDNWWGSPDGPGPVGPGSGDNVSTNVDYDPWLCAPWDSEDDCASDTVAPGGSVTTDPGTGPTPSDNTTTTVVSPAGGPVALNESDTHTQSLPAGYSFLGQEVSITANSSPNPNPLVLTFKLDASIVNGIDPADVVVRRNGVDVPDCAPANGTNAIPDPCVESRTIDGNGDLVIVVFSTAASIWDFLEPVPICTITGTPGDDFLEGTSGPDVICGLGGNDTIVGKGGGDELYGQGDNDTLYGKDGNDDMFGGGGNDDFFGGPGGDEMYGGLGDDRMWGGLGDELFSGGDGNDLMVGRFGNDTFDGGIGDDTMLGGDGNDVFDTGDGNNDVYGGLGIDLITAYAGNDRLRGGGGPDTILAGDGNNEILAGDGENSVTSGSGNDYIDAGLGDDTITAGDGNDSVFGDGGFNDVDLGEGDNYYLGGTGPDFVTSGTGVDKIETGLGDDNVTSGGGDDALYLGGGNNTADAGDGNNYVLGGPGIDNITTGTGNDRIDAEGGANIVNAGDGINAIFTGPGNNQLTTGSGADFILAGLGADTIFSGDGNDVVFAGRGTNSIDGGAGNDDYLVGGEDNDSFDGGPGTNDTCDAGSLGFDTQVNCENLVGSFP